MHRILICDSLHPAGLALFAEAGAEVHDLAAAERPRLRELAAGFDALVVRSTTRVTAELLSAGRRLKVVGRAGIGVDNVDVAAATELGILVVNAPTANLISATEHTFALLLALARRVAAADASIKRGEWDRKSYLGVELQGKTLGILGFGRIGQRVAERARAFEMTVAAHDPYLAPAVAGKLGVELLDLPALLARSDVVTLHTPLTAESRHLLSRERLARMKRGALLVNCARGGLVDEAALLAALESGHLAGAALDVFAQEPPASFDLARHPRVVATPHIGAQTREAQERIATETARMVLQALDGSLAISAVNLPFRPAGKGGEPFLELAERLGRLARALAEGRLREVQVDLWGIDEALRPAVVVAALKGALAPFLGEGVNYVNAERLARDREISVVRATHSEPADYPHLIAVSLGCAGGRMELAGRLFSDRDPRVVSIGGFRLEFQPRGRLLVLRNRDVPGVVGKLGMALGQGGINIADIHLARREGDPEAMAVLRLDQEPGPAVLAELASIFEVGRVWFVDMG
jgi:D-3-phosphoglycerate dehydrogenase